MKISIKKKERQALMFMAPFLILMFVFIITVFISGFFIGLTDAQGINKGEFIGLNNYKYVLTSKLFWGSIYVSFKLAVICIVIQIPVSFMLSVWIKSIPFTRLQGFLKGAFFVPSLVNIVVAGLLFRTMFTGDNNFVNLILRKFNLAAHSNWLMDKELSFYIIVITASWQAIGFQVIYFSANLQAISKSIYEAARIDGASKLQVLRKITIPHMKPAIIFIIITTAITSLMVCELILTLFPNGTHPTNFTIIYVIFQLAFFWQNEIGIASAAGWLAFFIILAVSLTQIRILGLGERHED